MRWDTKVIIILLLLTVALIMWVETISPYTEHDN